MTSPVEERVARVALGRLAEPGDPRLAGLVSELGAVEVYAHLRGDRDATGVRSDVAARLAGLDPEAELERAGRQGFRFVCPGDPEWPAPLADLDRAGTQHGRGGVPLGLWLRGGGRLQDLCQRSVSVVGSRSATTYGVSVAGDLSAHLAGERITVVSGAAFGIDQAAHRGALAGGGPTVAVLACGVDRAYPLAHRDLLAYIAESGLVVSELPPGCAPTKHRFLARNRVIAALSQGTVVVEAAVRSGALNTAGWATRLHRAVMGVPGPVTSAPSEGVHELLRSSAATLVTKGSDVLEVISPMGTHTQAPPREPERPRDRLTAQEQQVLDAVPVRAAAPTASVARAAGLAPPAVGAALRRLRSAGFVVQGEEGWRLSPGDEVGAPG